MKKFKLSLGLVICAIFFTQIIFANNSFLLNNQDTNKTSFDLEVSDLEAGNLKKAITDRLGSRNLKDLNKITVISGSISNDDFVFISEDLKDLKILDLANTSYTGQKITTTLAKTKLEEIYLPKSSKGYTLPKDFLLDAYRLKNLDLNGVIGFGENAFSNTRSLSSIDLSKVENLGQGGFINSGISTITFSESYDLPKEFFKNTKSLSNIDISNALTIGEGVFEGSGIEFVKMPKSYALEGYTFAKTKNLRSVDLSGATSLGVGDFMESSIEEVIFPVKFALPEYYFYKTSNLKTIDISKATEIGAGVFANSNIETVKFPKEFTLAEGLFQYSENLKMIDVSGANKIEPAVFVGSGLEKIVLPERFDVSNAMFGFMENLKSIDLSGAENLGSNIFVKKGRNYEFYRKFFDDGDLSSNIKAGIETVIFGKVVPSVARDAFSNLNDQPPVVFIPKSKDWDGFSNNIKSRENEIEAILRYEAYTYRDLMISKDTSIKIGFVNPSVVSRDDDNLNVKYQWYFNDQEIVNGNQPTFTIDNFSITDEGLYHLKVIVGAKTYDLFEISLEANELAIDTSTLYKGFFLNEKVDEDVVTVLYVKDDIKANVGSEFLDYDYDFSEVGNTSIKITYNKDDLSVVADYPVKVANTLDKNIKLKKGKSFTYDPMIDGFEFILTSNQKDYLKVETDENSSEITITALEKYKGEIDYKFNERVGQVNIEIVSNLFWLWIGLGSFVILSFALIIYLRITKGMFKVKKVNKA